MANVTVTVLESDGSTETDVEVLGVGRQAAAASKSLTLATEDKAVLDAVAASVAGATPAGTNNIGDVDVLTVPSDPFGANADAASATGSISAKLRFIAATGIPITGSVAVTGTFWQATQPVSIATAPALVAGTALIGKVSASHETSTIYNGTTALTPKFAKISCSSSGNNEIVAAVSAKKIRVIAWDVSPSDVVNLKWRTASTDLTGLYYAANAGNGVSKPWNPVGYFETVANEALNLSLSGAIPVGGSLVYVEV